MSQPSVFCLVLDYFDLEKIVQSYSYTYSIHVNKKPKAKNNVEFEYF